MKCVDNFDRLFEFNQLLLDLLLRRTIDNKHIYQIVGQQLARVANVNGSFCGTDNFCSDLKITTLIVFLSYPVYHR